MRVYTWCHAGLGGVFLSRGLVQRYLYDQDPTGWLAVARLAMGYPFTSARWRSRCSPSAGSAG